MASQDKMQIDRLGGSSKKKKKPVRRDREKRRQQNAEAQRKYSKLILIPNLPKLEEKVSWANTRPMATQTLIVR